MRIAFRAGTAAASAAISNGAAGTLNNVMGSIGATPNSLPLDISSGW
jgi:hypothetical protein